MKPRMQGPYTEDAGPAAPVQDYAGLGLSAFDEPSNNLPATTMGQFGGGVSAGAATDNAIAGLVTAQRVAVKRDIRRIFQEGVSLAAEADDKFYYRIPFRERAKDGKPERTTYVEGPSISCAMAAVSVYGNCKVGARIVGETPRAWLFEAQFIDLEKGVTISRSFQQRRSQSSGMKDAARQEDIVFQIGQSKAMRNVVVAALPLLVERMWTTAKAGLAKRIADRPEPARAWLIREIERLEIDLRRVERVVGKPAAKWLAPDMAKLTTELTSIKEGMADAEDLFPSDEESAEELAAAAKAEEKPAPKAEAPPPTAPAKARKPAPDPEPAPEAAEEEIDPPATYEVTTSSGEVVSYDTASDALISFEKMLQGCTDGREIDDEVNRNGALRVAVGAAAFDAIVKRRRREIPTPGDGAPTPKRATNKPPPPADADDDGGELRFE
jgi:hypothetical protein